MRPSTLPALITALLLLPGAALALGVGQPAPEIQAGYWLNTGPLTLGGLRGKIVVVEFWATWCPPCRASIPHLVALHKKHAGKGVVIVSLTQEDKGAVKGFVKANKMIYAIGGKSSSGGRYGVRGIPAAFIVDPEGKIAWTGHPMGGLDRALEQQLKKTPPSLLDPRSKATLAKQIQRVETAVAKKDYARAGKILNSLRGVDQDATLRERAGRLRATLAEAAASSLEKAEALLAEKEYTKACVAFRNTSSMAPGSGPSGRAKARLGELMKDASIRAAMRQAGIEEKAGAALDNILEREASLSAAQLYKSLKDVAGNFPKTEAGTAAGKRVAEMESNKTLMSEIGAQSGDKECRSNLAMARNFLNAGMPDKAKPYLRKIIDRFPDSEHASLAKKLMEGAVRD
jgi:thiol-disulfide isomerase/thioredoxin